MTTAEAHSDSILDTVERFLGACPELGGKEIAFGERATGEAPGVRMVRVTIGGVRHLVVAKPDG